MKISDRRFLTDAAACRERRTDTPLTGQAVAMLRAG